MSWYKSGSIGTCKWLAGLALLAGLHACRPQVSNNGAFDLSGFIKKDAARLKKLNRPVIKTVYQNGVSETQTVHIDNWEHELGLFIDADINKPTWRSNYRVTREDSLLVYRQKGTDQKVTELIINSVNRKIRWILIYTKTPKNDLYTTTQKLVYYPDSLYTIDIQQEVRFMKRNYYRVRGEIRN